MTVTQQRGGVRFSLLSDLELASLEPNCVLHPVERDMCGVMSIDRQADFLKGRYAIKSILEDSSVHMSGLLVAATSSGKPYLPSSPQLFCSISHTDGYVAAAVSTQAAIGVDVEKIRNRHAALLRDISDQDEINRLSSVYPSEILTTVLWAIKEAAAKADERIYPRKEYKVLSSGRVLVHRGACTWDVSVVVLPTHVSAVALAM